MKPSNTLLKAVSTTLSQSPNRAVTWTQSQAKRGEVLNHAKFLQKDLSKQPAPPAAIELIAAAPVTLVHDRIAVCQGHKQLGQGHPKVYINLEPKRPMPCGYCGLRYQMD